MAEIKIIKPHKGFQEKFVRTNVDVCISGGVLNPQPLDSLVATPCGFVRIGDLKAGDIICDTKGGTQRVNFVLDKGMQPCVEFTLMDGRTVESALSHNWFVNTIKKKYERVEAKDIISHIDAQEGKSAKRVSRYFIPACEPVSVEDKFANERTIHPYLLGCLLGDGWFSEKKFYIGFCTKDDEIIENIASLGYNIKKDQKNPNDLHYEIRDKHFKKLIEDLGLLGKHAANKFIPQCYKNAPAEVKLELIKGLFDTDGTCSVSKVGKVRCGYRTVSKQLALDIRDIIWSLGGRCVIHTTPATQRIYKGKVMNCAESYGLLVWLKNDKDLFRLSRKKDKAKGEGEKKNEHKLSIRGYRLLGYKHCVCINVSGEDHLYLTNNYVVTCNCGKAQPLHSKVLTPNGYVRIGDLKKGDVICDTQGGLQIIEEVFDRGVRDNYRVEFNNGAIVECCDEHLWTVYDLKTKKEITVELSVIMKDVKRYKISLPKSVYFNNSKVLPLSPYFLGIMIGDGTYTDDNGVLRINTDVECINRASLFEKFEYRIHDSKDRMPTISIHNNRIRQIFRDLNFWGQHSYTKSIPQQYLYSSVENRKELLRGLFDTDGFNDKVCSRIEYCTTSEQLCKDVVFLIRSLGGYAKVSTKIGSYKKDGVKRTCRKVYRIYCVFNNADEYFTLERKKTGNIKKKRLGLKFTSITNIGKEYMRCIKVSNPNSLYITDDFIVTHNTAGAVLMCAEPSLDPNFRGVFLRNNLGDLRSGGGILDEFKSMYRGGVNVVESGEPRAEFPSGARIDVTHIADQSRDKVRQRFKGRQYDLIYFDEMTGFSWECFTEVCTRNRGTAKWTGKIRGTTNPDRNHWLRKFLDWYIGIDGFIREDREGIVRYFYMSGETVNDVVWGDSKEEVYRKCKIQIDRQLAKINGSKGKATYEDIIRSFTFYLGRMSENVSSIGNNKGYIGAVAMSGGRNAEQILEGNWNVSPDEDLNTAIPPEKAREVFTNDEARNGDRWVTCDLADTGTDNFLALAWDGFHVYDALILNKTTPRQNAERLQLFAQEHDVADDHIIYDAIRGTYINDYIPDAVQFVSYRHPIGMYGRLARNLKDECYLRLVEAIKRNQFSISEEVAQRMYQHVLLKERTTIQNEFLEECQVVMFKDSGAGKKTLLSKKEMNRNLGKGRSMDLLDPCAMRMLPLLELPYGDELLKTMSLRVEDDDDYGGQSIYDDSFWC